MNINIPRWLYKVNIPRYAIEGKTKFWVFINFKVVLLQSNRILYALWNIALKPSFCHGMSDKTSKKLDFACFDWWVDSSKFSLLMVWTGRRWRRKSEWWGRWEETASTSFCLRLVQHPRSNTTLIGENWSDIYQVRGETVSDCIQTTQRLHHFWTKMVK